MYFIDHHSILIAPFIIKALYAIPQYFPITVIFLFNDKVRHLAESSVTINLFRCYRIKYYHSIIFLQEQKRITDPNIRISFFGFIALEVDLVT